MHRIVLAASLGLLVAGVAGGAQAEAQPTGAATGEAAPKKQKVLTGFYENRIAWTFTNGVRGQRNIADVVPAPPRTRRSGRSSRSPGRKERIARSYGRSSSCRRRARPVTSRSNGRRWS